MQSCIKCDIIYRLKDNLSNIYISASECYLVNKLKSILSTLQIPFEDINDVICVKERYFPDFVNTLLNCGSISDAETLQIQVLPLLPSESLTPQHLFAFRTLKAWHSLLSCEMLLHVIEQRALITYFQPIFTAQTKELFAFECLSRGLDKDGKIIPPVELFESAKLLGLQFALDRLAREKAIENASKAQITKHKVFINFVPTAIYNPKDCLQTTIAALYKYNLKPSNLVFEVIESEFIKDVAHLRGILDFYRTEGFQSALDDFGSGYASLKMLDELSPDYVKIDLHFIRGIDKDDFKQSVIKAIVSLARSKNITTLAEGIETESEYEVIKSLGVDLVQGYLFGRPSADAPKIYK